MASRASHAHNSIFPVTSAKIVLVFLIGFLFLTSEIQCIRKSCWLSVQYGSYIQSRLAMCSAITLLQASITSRLDYCNSLLTSAPYSCSLLSTQQPEASFKNLKAHLTSCYHPKPSRTPISLSIKLKVFTWAHRPSWSGYC